MEPYATLVVDEDENTVSARCGRFTDPSLARMDLVPVKPAQHVMQTAWLIMCALDRMGPHVARVVVLDHTVDLTSKETP